MVVGYVPLVENTIIKSDSKCNYACNAFNIKVSFMVKMIFPTLETHVLLMCAS